MSIRWSPPLLTIKKRADFELVEPTLTDAEARQEALRCVQCSTICDKCVEVCPNRANYAFTMQPVSWVLPVITAAGRRVRE